MSEAEAEVGTEPDEDVEVEDEDEEVAPDFHKLNKAKLQEIADDMDLEYSSKATKEELVALITSGEAATAAPVGELIPIIRVGHWVRFAHAKGVPQGCVGRDGVVVNALVKRAQGGDVITTGPYEYQDGSEVFLVEVRDTREQLSVTRDAFATFDTDISRLTVV